MKRGKTLGEFVIYLLVLAYVVFIHNENIFNYLSSSEKIYLIVKMNTVYLAVLFLVNYAIKKFKTN